ncbi:MAG: NADH-quinone oxidoreductase subunit J [Prevotellaceae bacterium]|jgi:NADH-quinone oxidoreductase subunit J|nr:NADH-quinone oxidoreductase subunit J [Prevotellaceae bacterium]
MLEQIIFYVLSFVVVFCSIFAVTTRRVIRSATCLLLVLLCTAAFYLLLNYHFLMAVQIAVYAGGVMVLFIFGIMLTHKPGDSVDNASWKRRLGALVASVAGIALCGGIIYFNVSNAVATLAHDELAVQQLGTQLMGTGKFQYLLVFELISILLLACIVGAIMVARKRK